MKKCQIIQCAKSKKIRMSGFRFARYFMYAMVVLGSSNFFRDISESRGTHILPLTYLIKRYVRTYVVLQYDFSVWILTAGYGIHTPLLDLAACIAWRRHCLDD